MNIYLFQKIIGTGVLILQIVTILIIFYLIYKKISKKKILFIENIFSRNGIIFILISLILSVIGSIIFSDIYKIEPCNLCWLQRVVMYPQVLIIIIAIIKKDTQALVYSFWLSLIGILFAGYQTIEQFRLINLPKTNCVIDQSAACSQINMLEFGYITFPVASLTIFIFIITMYFFRKKV